MALLPGATGRDVGEALRHLLGRVLDEPAANERARLSGFLRDWWRDRPAQADGPGSA
jgi:hypothetical protein